MLLLYLRHGRNPNKFVKIYIPLCFYFILIVLDSKKLIFRIYIPLCFYFIQSPLPGILRSLSSFTFHYASTLSISPSLTRCIIAIFTFHYASTLSFQALSKSAFLSSFTFHYASTLSYLPSENTMIDS